MTHTRLPFAQPFIETADIEAVVATLQSLWLTQGPKVEQFQVQFQQYIGTPFAVALNSATAALHLALACCRIGPGDEVITTPYTFASTANVIELVGAKPVFADIDLNIDAGQIEAKISDRTRAIICVHFAGLPCDLDILRRLCAARNITLIEDATHALGA